jgi:hypothetical protein
LHDLYLLIMKNLRNLFLPIIFIIGSNILFSCGEGEGGSSSTKPKARGAIGEIILAIDSAKWDGPVGEALRDVFEEDVPGLIRYERDTKEQANKNEIK